MLTKIRQGLQKQKGFTLVELLVVIAIIGILATIAVPRFTNATQAANRAKVQADLRTIDSAIAIFGAQNNGAAPADIAALVTANLLTAVPTEPTGATYSIGAAAPANPTAAQTAQAGRALATIGSTAYTSDGAIPLF